MADSCVLLQVPIVLPTRKNGGKAHDGCVFTDKQGLCYTDGGQAWCDENPGSEDCAYAGHSTAPAEWVPVSGVKLRGRSGEQDTTLQGCACVEDCSFNAKYNKMLCKDYDESKKVGVSPSPADSVETITPNSNKAGQCSCWCGQGDTWVSSAA